MDKPQPQRPGRPRKSVHKERITITLSLATIEYIDEQSPNRSEFIEQCVAEHRERAPHKER